MGRRGPRPKPTALEEMLGRPRKRARPQDEPEPFDAPPEPPAWLSDLGRVVWNDLAPEAYAIRLVKRLDSNLLAALCEATAHMIRCEDLAQRARETDQAGHAILVRSSSGVLYESPISTAARAARREVGRLAAELGLTPSGRVGLRANEADDPIARKFGL